MAVAASSSSSSLVVLGTTEALDTATSPCFDGRGADSWTVAEKIRSTLTSEGELRRRCAMYKLPKAYKVLCAGDWPPCRTPPKGSNTVCIYESMLEAGIRIPLHEFYAMVLVHYNLAPSQLCPNAWRYLAGFVLLCERAGVEPANSMFRYFFKLCAHVGDQQGWYHFVPYARRRLFRSAGNLPCNEGWKKRFFFLNSGPAGTPWWCPKKWGTPSTAAYGEPVLTDDARSAINKLEEVAKMEDIDLMELLHMSRDKHNLPVLRLPVKTEAGNVGSELSSSPKRKRKSLSEFWVTPPQQKNAGAGASSSPPDPAPCTPSSGADIGELSTTQLVCRLMQKAEVEHSQTKELLREATQAREEHAAEVAHLKEELSAAKAEHAAEVAHLKEELSAAKAEHAADVAHLKEELSAAKAEQAEDVAHLKEALSAAKAEHAAELAQLKQEHAAEATQLREKLEAEEGKRLAKISQFALELDAAETRHAKALEMVEAEQSKVRQLTEQLQARNAEYTSAMASTRAETTVLCSAQGQQTALVRQLKALHQAADAEHATKARQLTELLQAAESKAAQLKEQLEAEKVRHADEVMAIKVECQNKVINAKHTSSNMIGEMLSERYAAGLEDMRELVLLNNPELDLSRLSPAALAPYVPPGFHPSDKRPPISEPVGMDLPSSVDA